MKKIFLTVSIICFILSVAHAADWTGFDAGFAAAAANKKPVIVDFATDWCVWCKKMDKEVFSKSDVKDRLQKEFNTVRLDAESPTPLTYKGAKLTSRSFTQKMNVQGFPTLIVFNSSGDPVAKLPGYVDSKAFHVFLDYIKNEAYKKVSFETYYSHGGKL